MQRAALLLTCLTRAAALATGVRGGASPPPTAMIAGGGIGGLFTALTLRKPILVVWNQSKHTVQAALGWIQEVPQLHFLLENELLPIQEDVQMARTCAERIAAANVEPWVAAGELNWQTVEVPTVIGKHDFRNREDLAPELGLLAA